MRLDVLTDSIVAGALLEERVLQCISRETLQTLERRDCTYLRWLLGSGTSLRLGEWRRRGFLSLWRLSLRKESISEHVH